MKKINYSRFTLLGLIIFLLTSGSIFAQKENVVTGKVFPPGLITPMRDVSVHIQGDESTKVFTDGNGVFRIEVSSFPVNLVFIKETYAELVVTVKKPSDITVYMNPAEKTVNDYGQEVGVRVSLNPESRDGILMLSSTDNRFRYWFDNRVYFDGAIYSIKDDYGDDGNKIGNGVNIRRMRFAMKAILWGNWGAEIDFDFGNNAVDIKDAYIRYIGRNWQIKAGNFREPFSMETMTTSRYITFMERPYPTEQAPSRHLGVDYKMFLTHFFMEVGVFSSNIANDLIRDQNKSKGTNAGWSVTGRFAWAPIKKDRMVLHFGVAGSYRVPKIQEIGDPENSFRYGENAETEINRKKYIDTDWMEDCQTKIIFGTEVAYAVKNFRVQGEWIMTRIQKDKDEVPEAEDKVKLGGFYVMGAWLVNNADYYYNMADAEFSQIDFRNNKKGAFEVALRYSFMDANSFKDGETTPYLPGGSGETYTLGLSYYFNYNVKVMLNYAFVNHDRWADGKGKYTTFNRDAAGNDITPTGQGGIDFHTIQARLLIAF